MGVSLKSILHIETERVRGTFLAFTLLHLFERKIRKIYRRSTHIHDMSPDLLVMQKCIKASTFELQCKRTQFLR